MCDDVGNKVVIGIGGVFVVDFFVIKKGDYGGGDGCFGY